MLDITICYYLCPPKQSKISRLHLILFSYPTRSPSPIPLFHQLLKPVEQIRLHFHPVTRHSTLSLDGNGRRGDPGNECRVSRFVVGRFEIEQQSARAERHLPRRPLHAPFQPRGQTGDGERRGRSDAWNEGGEEERRCEGRVRRQWQDEKGGEGRRGGVRLRWQLGQTRGEKVGSHFRVAVDEPVCAKFDYAGGQPSRPQSLVRNDSAEDRQR